MEAAAARRPGNLLQRGFMQPQPILVDDWGCQYYGKAHTITGDIWWYEQDGKRYPLRPLNVCVGSNGSSLENNQD